MLSCCYKCEDRKVNCHSRCPRYLEWQQKNQERLDAIERERIKDATTIARQLSRMKSLFRRRMEGLK